MNENKKDKLWQKKGHEINPAVTSYMISKNLEADNAILPYDVEASIAHAKMLVKVGLLKEDEADKITKTLAKVKKLHANGDFVLNQHNEDVHTEIEGFLVKELGDIGKKIHVGRSRNDQVLTAMRLYIRESLEEISNYTLNLSQTILDFAKKYEFVPMPGFTHMQHAMPSSVGQWAGSIVESLLNDLTIIDSARNLNNQNPLGSAAGFGTAMPLDREYTAKLLDFDKVQQNSLYCQNSRGKFEAYTITSLLQIMFTLGKLANDLVIMTSQEFDFFKVDKSMTTGSSIMPQKQNLDIMEVLRANVSIIQSLQIQCQTVGMNLISGYNKDLKITKKPIMDSFEIVRESLKITDLLFDNLEPNQEKLLSTFDDVEIFAADYANQMVEQGMSFRDAYKEVGENLQKLAKQDPIENIKSKTHIGSTGNLQLEQYQKQIDERR
jgi:argininosuccinate lyase